MSRGKKLHNLFIAGFFTACEGAALAAEIGLTTEANAPPQGDMSYITWFAFVVAVWFVVVIANTLASSPPDHMMGFIASIGEGPVAHHLYFPCRVGGRPGHLRTMSLKRAEVLVQAGLRRGEWLDLEVHQIKVRAKVMRTSRMRRNGDHLVLLLLRPGSTSKKSEMRALLQEWTGIGDMGAGKPLMTRRGGRLRAMANR
jgi:hypothetical protein